MDARGTAVGPKVDKGKAVRARRSWSKFEEDALIHCITDIVNDGWKAKNGFKAGFQRELEKKMHKMLLGTDIVAHPHINSKIHVWKKEYGALCCGHSCGYDSVNGNRPHHDPTWRQMVSTRPLSTSPTRASTSEKEDEYQPGEMANHPRPHGRVPAGKRTNINQPRWPTILVPPPRPYIGH
ncbi:hypothetical protein ACS0TY_028849 [Phlomoides rotata]